MKPTRWHVVTGAPCSGKTAVIRELATLGHRVVHEAARAIIDKERKRGRSVDDVRADKGAFERRVLLEKIRRESCLEPEATVFLDRGIPDSIAYFRLSGLDPAPAVEGSRRHRYRRVFVMDRLTCETDGVRIEDDATAAAIEGMIEAAYRQFGYTVIRIPLMPVDDRVAAVLKQALRPSAGSSR